MLFVPTVKIGEMLQQGLRSRGYDLPFFHSRLGTANDRDVLLGRFAGRLDPAANVVICTNAFGMGLDLPNVRLVVHWQHPASVEDYLQEFGRAGRDGAPSVAVLFTGSEDVGLLTYMAELTVRNADLDAATKAVTLRAKRQGISQMQKRANERGVCFRSAIEHYFGQKYSGRWKALAVRIVEWIFSRGTKITPAPGCCDKCDQVDLHNLTDWAAHIWASDKKQAKRGASAG
jgi:ATP-dependent DNA helicase RecQ